MKTKNTCYTYFQIIGELDSDKITELLGIIPFEVDHNSWKCGLCKTYDPMLDNMFKKTINELKDKVDILNKIREEYNAEFYLVAVPEMHLNDINQCVSPSLEIIDFCYETRCQIDIDLYLLK